MNKRTGAGYTGRVLIGFLLLFVFSFIARAEGNGEIELIAPDTLLMSWDTNRTWINNTLLAWSEDGMPGEFYETDPEFGVEFYIQNRNFYRITLIRNPEIDRHKEFDVHYCTYSPVSQYADEEMQTPYHRCPEGWHSYKFEPLKAGRSHNIRIPDNEWSAFAWWVGDGAGGGGGLPVCEGVTIAASYNQTQGDINFQFRMGGKLSPIGGFTAGCTPLMLMWQDYEGTWGQIDNSNTSNYLDCDGKLCRNNSPGWNWDYRNINCDKEGSVNVRMYGTYIYRTRQYATWSATQAITCNYDAPEPSTVYCPESYMWQIRYTPNCVYPRIKGYRGWVHV